MFTNFSFLVIEPGSFINKDVSGAFLFIFINNFFSYATRLYVKLKVVLVQLPLPLLTEGKQGRWHRGRRGGMSPDTFLRSIKKNGVKRKKRNSFKAETIKRLSPSTKCYCFSHYRASIIQKFPNMVADNTFHCFMAPPLWNSFHRPWKNNFGNN